MNAEKVRKRAGGGAVAINGCDGNEISTRFYCVICGYHLGFVRLNLQILYKCRVLHIYLRSLARPSHKSKTDQCDK